MVSHKPDTKTGAGPTNLDRISIAVPKGQKDVIKAHAEARGESVNAFVGRAIEETMQRDKAAPGASEGQTEGK